MKVLELKQSQLQRVLAFGLLALTVYAVFISHTKMLVQIQSGPHLPATGLNVLPSFIEDVARLAMAWIVLLAASALAFALVRGETKKFLGPGFFVFGISSLTVQLLTTEGRLVFSYFPAFASIGFGAAVVVRTYQPLAILLSSLYLSAASHKLLNFSKMLEQIRESVGPELSRELISSPAVIDFLVKSMGYVVAPLEFVMGILVMVPRLRVAGFLLAWVFHSALVILTNDGVGLGFVGYAVLLTHVLLATHFDSIRLKLRGRDGAIGLICLLGAVALALSSGSKYAGLIWFFGLYVPLAAVYLRLMLSAQPPLELPTERWAICVNRIWPVALVLWFIYPIAIGYRNQQFGWAMFSRASRDKVAFCATAATHPCSDSWSLYPHI